MKYFIAFCLYLLFLLIACGIVAEPLPYSKQHIRDKKKEMIESLSKIYFIEFFKNVIVISKKWQIHIIPIATAIAIASDISHFYQLLIWSISIVMFAIFWRKPKQSS
ncbi:hypothetical protein [Gilvibacter sediminis]|uniref:hypothetical protein n=1 Tax=Gilvibacter sediminis TaxID=379071 RepID=UPI002350FFF5|nr:hypothetical protein [Gilvibacter sediminis]MDC7997376.1 hypothetical protein [Gilvibacter sediminis]